MTPEQARRFSAIYNEIIRQGGSKEDALLYASGRKQVRTGPLTIPTGNPEHPEANQIYDLYDREVIRRRREGEHNKLPRKKWQ